LHLRPGDFYTTVTGDVYRIDRVMAREEEGLAGGPPPVVLTGLCTRIDPSNPAEVLDLGDDPPNMSNPLVHGKYAALVGFAKHFARHGRSFDEPHRTREWAKECLDAAGVK
jgi:hypothetical protein